MTQSDHSDLVKQCRLCQQSNKDTQTTEPTDKACFLEATWRTTYSPWVNNKQTITLICQNFSHARSIKVS